MSLPWEDFTTQTAPWEDFEPASEETHVTPRGVPFVGQLTPFVPQTSTSLPKRELPSYILKKDETDYAGESLLGISPEDIPSGANTTAPWLTIPLSATAKTAASVGQFVTSPRGIVQIGVAETPAAPAVYAKWAYDLIKGAKASATDAVETVKVMIRDAINRQMGGNVPHDDENVQRLAEDAVNTAAQIVGVAGIGAKTVSTAIKLKPEYLQAVEKARQTAPATAEALKQQVTESEVPSAIHKETGELLRPVLEPGVTEEGQKQVPTDRPSAEAGARSTSVEGEEKQNVEPLPGEQLVAVVRPDGTTYQASFGGKYYEGFPGRPASIATLNKEGQWTHGATKKGEIVIEPDEKLTQAAFTDDQGNVHTGSNHPEILNRLGIEGLESRESRNTPQFGYSTNKRPFVTREVGGAIAKAAGQNLEEFDPGEPVHSDQVESATKPGVPMGSEKESDPMVTVYRGEGQPYSPEQFAKIPEHIKLYAGQWFTESAKEAKNYADTLGGKVKQMTLPRSELEKYRIAELNEFRIPQDVQARYGEPSRSRGIAASVRNKWTTATQDKPLGSEAGFINIDPIKDLVEKSTPYVKGAFNLIRDIGKEETQIGRFDDYRKSVLGWSGRLQTSFQEAADAQKEIQSQVPNKVRREGITNWIQADGDATVLQQRMAATTDPKLRRGYEAALNLTPEEVQVANDVRDAFNTLGQRGQNFGVLNNFKDNYVTQIWDLGRGPMMAGTRTLQQNFRFNKASTFPTFFDGEQAGYVPKTKDISKILPMYLHEMNSVIASRQLVQDLSHAVGSDGRPLLAPKGNGKQVTNPGGGATLVNPQVGKVADTGDYKTIENQPALHKWNWVGTDENGNPIFLNGDLSVHPEAYGNLKNILGKSAIREWYNSEGSAISKVPKVLVKGLDVANSVTKQTMLGLLSPFHQVQEGTHALGHRVNPFFNIPDIDLVNNSDHRDAANHGLMLQPDRASANQFMEGFKMVGLVQHIPVLGRMANWYSDYLFHDYIPGIKYKTYDAILNRNKGVYERQIASGEVTLDDVKHLSAEQANAAFGHLNYTDLSRNPTVQHVMRLGLLAPDFLEARARFTGQAIKGATGLKVGREQAVALATLALGQAATAYIAAQLTGGEWDEKHPFEFHKDNRRYSMRSVPEDLSNLMNNTRVFVHSRISPIIGKGVLQLSTGVDWQGRKISAADTLKELAEQPIPISVKGFVGVGNKNLTGLEQLASSIGLRISRYSPQQDVFKLVDDWMKGSSDPKIQELYKEKQQTTYPESVYKPLRNAISTGDNEAANKAYTDLLKTHTPKQVVTAMKPRPFTGSWVRENEFKASLTDEQRKIYDAAVKERKDMYDAFLKIQ